MARRVAVTGCGLVTGAGSELETFWSSIASGTCFIGPLRHFSVPGLDGLLGVEIDLASDEEMPEGADPYRDRVELLAVAAARRAVADAGLQKGVLDPPRSGVAVGTTMGEERQVSAVGDRWPAEGAASIDAGFLGRASNHALAARLARRFGLGGPALLSATACASGNAALSWGFDAITSGAADLMVAGGVDVLTRAIYAGFTRMGALSKSVCRPFDKRRDGVSFGEAGAFLVLEEMEHARRRGARIRAELAGFGLSNDAHHITAPEPSGEGFARAMRQALSTSGTPLDEVDYVSAHGTGTPYNDVAETRALKAVFGDRAGQVPMSSIKSMIGHSNGAASAVEAIACVLGLQKQAAPPTAGLEVPDPECDLDYVPGHARPMKLQTCLNLAAGFGGFNVCTVWKRVP
jgi:3-oxoacyl-[acyl-carrier-protein] synthase II